MARLKVEDLKKIKERVREKSTLGEGKDTVKITVHMGTCGIAAGADKVYDALNQEIKKSKSTHIKVIVSACMGMCSSEPNVTVQRMTEDAILYQELDADKMREIFKEHVLGGNIKSEYALARIK